MTPTEFAQAMNLYVTDHVISDRWHQSAPLTWCQAREETFYNVRLMAEPDDHTVWEWEYRIYNSALLWRKHHTIESFLHAHPEFFLHDPIIPFSKQESEMAR